MAYDYVLAGGGSAGATLAARLSEDHKITVCLIEAGGEGRSVVVRAPIGGLGGGRYILCRPILGGLHHQYVRL